MRVAVVGTGYVGLVSGVCLAAKGHKVICVDIDPTIVQRLNDGVPTIHEDGLSERLKATLATGHFSVTADLNIALAEVDLVIIAVGTPSKEGVIDLKYVRSAARGIGEYLRTTDRNISVVVKSTVVPGTTDSVVREEIERASGKTHPAFGLGMNPEFLREGDAIRDFDQPDRIVLGYEDDQTLERLEALFAPWAVDKVKVNTRTAELIKYANNALLATQISTVNEIANLAAAIGGIDMMDVVEAVQLDKRWNPIIEGAERVWPEILTYLVPGCGFGGSCFPKDVQALRSQGEQHGLDMRMMNAVLDVNNAQPVQVLDIIERERGELAGRRVLLLGLAFKPGTDDVRESASLKIAGALEQRGAIVTAHDPIASENFKRFMGPSAAQIVFVENWIDEVPKAEIIIVATKWSLYAALADMNLADKVLFDARRMFAPLHAGGAQYLSIGRRAA